MQIALGIAAAGLLLAPVRPLRTALDWACCIRGDRDRFGSALPYGAPGLAAATLWRS